MKHWSTEQIESSQINSKILDTYGIAYIPIPYLNYAEYLDLMELLQKKLTIIESKLLEESIVDNPIEE